MKNILLASLVVLFYYSVGFSQCPPPTITGVSGITSSSAEIEWTPNGTETTWDLEYGPAGFTPGMGTTIAGLIDDSVSVTGLMPLTDYEYYLCSNCGALESDIVITGIIDASLPGGLPKAIEIYAIKSIPDMSVYALGTANNGGGTDGIEYFFPQIPMVAGQFYYITTDSAAFNGFFGFDADAVSFLGGSFNGDDAVELFKYGQHVDIFGDPDVSGTGLGWEYKDGWAYRSDATGADGGAFVEANWFFSGVDALDNVIDNATAPIPFPIGTYTPGTPPTVTTECTGPYPMFTTLCDPPVGDALNNPIIISTLPYVDSQMTNQCFTDQIGNTAEDVFYQFTTSSCPDTVKVSLCGSSFDTYLHILDDAGTVINSNDDGPTCAPQSELDLVGLMASTTYYIVVEGPDTENGTFSLTVTETGISGGILSTTDPTTICVSDGVADPINVSLLGATGDNSAWVITDQSGLILGLPAAPPFDLEGAGPGVCLIWHVSHDATFGGAIVGNNATTDLTGCYSLSNPITVTRNEPLGGMITTTDPTTICAGDGVADPINVDLTGEVGASSAWVITDQAGVILGLPAGPPFDLEGAGAGVCLIWHMSSYGTVNGAMLGNNATTDLVGCYSLSNPITVTRNGANGGTLATTDPTNICVGDGIADPINVTLTDEEGDAFQWIITDDLGNILDLPAAPPFDLEGAGVGTCLIWNLSSYGTVTGASIGNNANTDLVGCYSLSNPITVIRSEATGGNITTTDPTTICAGDGIADPIMVTLTGEVGDSSAWVITDQTGMILGLPAAPPFDLEGAGGGTCLIWHISYSAGVTGIAVGNNANTDITGCYSLSNAITVIRDGVNGGNLTTTDPTNICVGDGVADPINVTLTDVEGDATAWVITDPAGTILDLPAGPPFDLEGAGLGTCLIWNVSYNGTLMGASVGNNANTDLAGCYSLSNPITVVRSEANGGTIDTSDPTTICAGDGVADPINVVVLGSVGDSTAWVITDPAGTILDLPASPPFDLEGAGGGTCLIWHMSYNAGLTGVAIGNNATTDIVGCYSLSNPITVVRNGVNGGNLTTTDPTNICVGDGIGDPINVTLTDVEGDSTAWVITDQAGMILGLPAGPPFDLEGAGLGTCLIWNVSYNGTLTGAAVGNNATTDLAGCYSLSNAITVVRTEADGGTIDTTDPTTICAGDGIADPIMVTLTGEVGDSSAWVITDEAGTILGLPTAPPFDLEGAGSGTCLIWHMSYNAGLTGVAIGNNATTDIMGCYSLSNPITVTRNTADGGTISTNDPTTICAGNGIPDPIDVMLMGAEGDSSAWVITDAVGNILALPAGPPFDLDGAGAGTCLIWHVSYNADFAGAMVGNNATTDLSGCYSLSNPITVTRDEAVGGTITTNDPTNICVGDGIGDPIMTSLTGNIGDNSQWVITDALGNILDLPAAPPFDLEGAGVGVCLIWHLSYNNGLTGAVVGNNANTDLNGCYGLSNPITVTRNDLEGTGVASNTTCAGSNDGSIDITVTGGSNVSYTWNNGEMTEDLSNLAPGNYTVTVDDASGCQIVLGPYTIDANPASLIVTLNNAPVSTGSDGVIDLTTTGGTMPYTYAWSDGASTEDRSGLAVGNYTVTVTDALGCSLVVGPISVAMPVGTESIDGLSLFNVFPNPTSDAVQVDLAFESGKDISIQIVNTLGQIIYSIERDEVMQSRFEINTQSFAEGIYFVRLISKENNRQAVEKLAVKR